MEDVIFEAPEVAEPAWDPQAVEAQPTESAAEPEQQTEQQQEVEPARPKKTARERIQEITWARHEAERRAAEAERQLAEFRAAKQPEPAPSTEKPTLECALSAV